MFSAYHDLIVISRADAKSNGSRREQAGSKSIDERLITVGFPFSFSRRRIIARRMVPGRRGDGVRDKQKPNERGRQSSVSGLFETDLNDDATSRYGKMIRGKFHTCGFPVLYDSVLAVGKSIDKKKILCLERV